MTRDRERRFKPYILELRAKGVPFKEIPALLIAAGGPTMSERTVHSRVKDWAEEDEDTERVDNSSTPSRPSRHQSRSKACASHRRALSTVDTLSDCKSTGVGAEGSVHATYERRRLEHLPATRYVPLQVQNHSEVTNSERSIPRDTLGASAWMRGDRYHPNNGSVPMTDRTEQPAYREESWAGSQHDTMSSAAQSGGGQYQSYGHYGTSSMPLHIGVRTDQNQAWSTTQPSDLVGPDFEDSLSVDATSTAHHTDPMQHLGSGFSDPDAQGPFARTLAIPGTTALTDLEYQAMLAELTIQDEDLADDHIHFLQ